MDNWIGYALWLVPSRSEYSALERLMMFRPRHYQPPQNSRSFPRFAPHITVATFTVSSTTAPSLATLIPSDIRPVSALFESVNVGSTYLGAFSVKIARTHELMALHDKVLNGLAASGIEAKSRSFPHMSLFYVDESEGRQQLNSDLLSTGRVTTVRRGHTTTVLLKADPQDRETVPLEGFVGTQIWLVDCMSKNVEGWEVKEKLSLRAPHAEDSSAHRRHQGRSRTPATADTRSRRGTPRADVKPYVEPSRSDNERVRHGRGRQHEKQRRTRKQYDDDKVGRNCGLCAWLFG